MLKAQQSQLAQTANQQLLEIRNSEVSYYENYFAIYSNLAAMCVSLVVNTVTQVQAYDSQYDQVNRYLKSWFWMACTYTICVGIQCVIAASLTLVFGLGLAIKGPLGSMVRAIRGMAKVSTLVYRTYICTMLGYVVVNSATYWMVAYTIEATLCSLIMAACVVGTVLHARKIERRFYYKDMVTQGGVGGGSDGDGDDWKEDRGDSDSDRDRDRDRDFVERLREHRGIGELHPAHHKRFKSSASNPLHQSLLRQAHLDDGVTDGQQYQPQYHHQHHHHQQQQKEEHDGGVGPVDDLYLEGYLTARWLKAPTGSGGGSAGAKKGLLASLTATTAASNTPWERFYFVLSGHALWFYRDKSSFDLNPEKPERLRPMDLGSYRVAATDGHKLTFTLEAADGADSQHRPWEFRCDTAEELNGWLTHLSAACNAVM